VDWKRWCDHTLSAGCRVNISYTLYFNMSFDKTHVLFSCVYQILDDKETVPLCEQCYKSDPDYLHARYSLNVDHFRADEDEAEAMLSNPRYLCFNCTKPLIERVGENCTQRLAHWTSTLWLAPCRALTSPSRKSCKSREHRDEEEEQSQPCKRQRLD